MGQQDGDTPKPDPDEFSHTAANVADTQDESEAPARVWWQRSAPLGASAALAIGAATLWFGNMLARVPLDQHATFGLQER